VVGWAADGASAHFSLMRELRAPPAANAAAIEVAACTLQGKRITVRLPARITCFNLLLPAAPIFDIVHLLNLFRNAAMRAHAAMKVGDYNINLLALRDHVQATCGPLGMEGVLGVRYSDWCVSDRMNYASAQRLFSCKVLDYVKRKFGGVLDLALQLRGAREEGITPVVVALSHRFLVQAPSFIFSLAIALCAPT